MVNGRSLRLALATLTVLAGSLLGVATTATSADAAVTPDSSGGGCIKSTSDGVTVSSCISASGANLEPDAYVISDPGCTSAYIWLYDATADKWYSHGMSCAAVHHGPFAFPGINGHVYYNYTQIILSNNEEPGFWSPAETFSN